MQLGLVCPSGRQAGRQGSEPLAFQASCSVQGPEDAAPWALIVLAPAPKTLEAARSVLGRVLCPWELGSVPGTGGQSSAKLSLTRDGHWALPAHPVPAAAGQGLQQTAVLPSEGWKGEPGQPAGWPGKCLPKDAWNKS